MCRLKQLLILPVILFSGQLSAQVTNIVGPPGSGDFGYSVTVLSNGNYVITDPNFNDGPVVNAGAVYLYDGKTHSLISTLKGKSNNDFVGLEGVITLNNGNFVVLSHSVDNGSIVDCGAITWINGVSGLSDVVTPANSLFGTATNDSLGSGDNNGQGGVVVFDNGNYAVVSPGWDNGNIVNAGAVTLLNGNDPTSGFISSGNSLVGSSTNDRVGSDGIFILDNNHFIVKSYSWNNGTAVNAGAITWCNGISLAGPVSSANSLVGTTTGDFYEDITGDRIRKLTNGNFVVINPNWDNAGVGAVDAGAVTWGSNSFGVSGVIGSNNSLVGTGSSEQVGGLNPASLGAGVVALSNGNYVVITPIGYAAAGAVTWGNGNAGVTGVIDTTNSLVGNSDNLDQVGNGGVVALANGNYVVISPGWHNEAGQFVGAVTWGNGTTGTTGKVSVDNSLVGSTNSDFDNCRVTPLSNGHFVVSTPKWDYGTTVNAGAVTWGNGNTGITGIISSSRSLIELSTHIDFGFQVTPLPNGNYVVSNPFWDNGVFTDAGAVTWANGTTGITGFVNSTNSLVGSNGGDMVGGGIADIVGGGSGMGYVTVVNNGNYVIGSPDWNNGAGAATWANGMTGITGTVNSSNSLVGTITDNPAFNITGDRVSFGVHALTNGNYVVASRFGNSMASQFYGAVTWGNGNSGVTGPVTASNSLTGGPGVDFVGGVQPLQNGNYLVQSHIFAGGPGTGKGSITWGDGLTGTVGIVSSDNSLVGSSADDDVGDQATSTYDYYVIQSMFYDNGNITDAGAVTLASTTSGIRGVITSCNSIRGELANNGWRFKFAHSDLYGYLICGQAAHNVVYILKPSSADIAASTDSTSVNINGSAPVPLLSSGGCQLIATLESGGANPVQGLVNAKVWSEAAVPVYDGQPFVSRHYEITPALNASTATARITLYFTQQEFDDYNAHTGSISDLPANDGDTSGIANLRIIKYPGISSDNTGLPGSYTGTPVVIDPTDQSIVWNNSLGRWEVSFDVTGFSGFFVQANSAALPLTLLEFTGQLVNNNATLRWKTTDEFNTASFDIERSIDGRSFISVGSVSATNQPGIHNYLFNENDLAALGVQFVYYRLKMIDIDGRFTYSWIITLTLNNDIAVSFYPNPAKSIATLTVTLNEPMNVQLRIVDDAGRTVRINSRSMLAGRNTLPIDVSGLSTGIYYLELTGKDYHQRIRFIKM